MPPKRQNTNAPDSSKNGNIVNEIDKVREETKNRVTLRIDRNTVILVKPENCNAEYAQKYKSNYPL